MKFLKKIFSANKKIQNIVKKNKSGEVKEKSLEKNNEQKEIIETKNNELKNVKPIGLKKIGEINKCPYCKNTLDKIPTRKKKCEFCNKYIYVRTRPLDKKKILITEKQKIDVEKQWEKYFELREYSELLENPEYLEARNLLKKQFGFYPSLGDLKWKMFNKEILKYTDTGQWSLYTHTKFKMASLLKKEGKNKEALYTFFEVCYLDLNFDNNINNLITHTNKLESNSQGVILHPRVISIIEELIEKLNYSNIKVKNIFIKINEQTSPLKNMPIPIEDAWKIVSEKIKDKKEINAINFENQDSVSAKINELIKNKKTGEASNLIYRLIYFYYPKKQSLMNINKLKIFVRELLKSKEKIILNAGERLLILLLKKNTKEFEEIATDYIKYIKFNYEKLYLEGTQIIGELASINVDWVKSLIPKLKEIINNKNSFSWIKENAQWNLDVIKDEKLRESFRKY